MSETSKTMDLLHRIGSDVSKLRDEIVSLLHQADHSALSENAQKLALRGKRQLREGRDYATHYLKEHPGQSTAGLLGGLVLLGAVGAGIYYLCKNDCVGCRETVENESDPYDAPEPNLPSYIS